MRRVLFVLVLAVLALVAMGGLAQRVEHSTGNWWACLDEPGVLYRALWSSKPVERVQHDADVRAISAARRECSS